MDMLENRCYDCIQALIELVQAARATGNPEDPVTMREMDRRLLKGGGMKSNVHERQGLIIEEQKCILRYAGEGPVYSASELLDFPGGFFVENTGASRRVFYRGEKTGQYYLVCENSLQPVAAVEAAREYVKWYKEVYQ